MTKKELQYLLNAYGVQPRKQQGQNFLLDEEVIAESVAAAQLTKEDTVLEIGPGFGVLTTALAQSARTVVAVEQDRELFPAIQKLSRIYPNIQPRSADIRTFNLQEAGLQHHQYILVANLPYNITSWVLRNFLESEPTPLRAVVMVQKEVAERVVAQPGRMSVLACAVQLFAEPEIVRFVSRNSFYPAPHVDSALLKITLRSTPLSPDPSALLRLIKIGFASKRKQLQNNLQAGLHLSATDAKSLLERASIDSAARPQELSLEQWGIIRKQLSE